MSEVAQSYAWIMATIKADTALMAAATGGAFQGFAPIGTAKPYALVTHQSGTDLLTMNAVRVFTHLLLQIKAVGPASGNGFAALEIIANRIDALFGSDGPSRPSTGGTILSSYREQEIAYEEVVSGVQFSHLGGLYHIELQGS